MTYKQYNRPLFFTSFTLYAIMLLWVVVFKWTNYFSVQVSINNFRHLDLITRYNEAYPWLYEFKPEDFVLNIILFLPLGLFYLLPLKRKWLILPISLLLTITFEVSQFFTCIGMFNSYDLLGNFIGAILGYILFCILHKKVSKKLIDITNIVVTIIFSPIAIYAIYMTITNIDVYI